MNHTDVVDIALLRAMVMKCGEEEGLYVLITWFVDHHPQLPLDVGWGGARIIHGITNLKMATISFLQAKYYVCRVCMMTMKMCIKL